MGTLSASLRPYAGCSVSVSDQVLRCTVEGERNGGVRIRDLTIVPPRGGAGSSGLRFSIDRGGGSGRP